MNIIRTAITALAVSLAASAAHAEIRVVFDAGAIIKLQDAGATAAGEIDGMDYNEIVWSGGYGGGTVNVTLNPGYGRDFDIWMRESRAQRIDEGVDLMIVNNGDGSDFLELTCTDARVKSYPASSRKGGKVALSCGRLVVR